MTYNYAPELVEVVKMLPQGSLEDPIAAREYFEKAVAMLSPNIDTTGLSIKNLEVPGYENNPPVKIRIYSPENMSANTPALLHIHGGGYVIGSLETEHPIAVHHALKLGITVVSVDYRLAPEHPYPAGLHDCYAALTWMHEQATHLNIDTNRIGLHGESAGAGLAAALTLMARKLSGPGICFQLLSIPELDDRLETTSATLFVDTPIWNRSMGIQSWQYYLGKNYQPGDADVPVTAAPARATDLTGLPPALINTMEFDPLRDEGITYALRLLEAGVPVELHNYPGTFHGSVMFPADVSKRQKQDTLSALKRGLGIN